MTEYTITEFATHMLKTMGLVAAEETPTSADIEWAEQVAASEIMMLNSMGIPVWNGSEVSVPQEYLSTLARRCGLAVAPSFGLSDLATAQLAMREAERYLVILAGPNARAPSVMMTNDIGMGGAGFNFTTGQ